MTVGKPKTRAETREALVLEVARIRGTLARRAELEAELDQVNAAGAEFLHRAQAIADVLGYTELDVAIESITEEELAGAELELAERAGTNGDA